MLKPRACERNGESPLKEKIKILYGKKKI